MFQSGTICSQQPSFELNFVSLIRPSVHQWNNSTMFYRKRPKISHKSSYKTVTSLSNVNSQVCNYSVLISHFPSQLNTRIPLWPVVLVADILTLLLRCWFGTYHTAKSCPQLAVEFWTLIKQYIERTRKKINRLSSLKYFWLFKMPLNFFNPFMSIFFSPDSVHSFVSYWEKFVLHQVISRGDYSVTSAVLWTVSLTKNICCQRKEFILICPSRRS